MDKTKNALKEVDKCPGDSVLLNHVVLKVQRFGVFMESSDILVLLSACIRTSMDFFVQKPDTVTHRLLKKLRHLAVQGREFCRDYLLSSAVEKGKSTDNCLVGLASMLAFPESRIFLAALRRPLSAAKWRADRKSVV